MKNKKVRVFALSGLLVLVGYAKADPILMGINGGTAQINSSTGSVLRVYIGNIIKQDDGFSYGTEVGVLTYPNVVCTHWKTPVQIDKGIEYADTQFTLGGWGVDMLATAQMAIIGNLSLVGKTGIVDIFQTVTARTTLKGSLLSDQSNEAGNLLPEVVIGVAYPIDPSLSVDVAYDYVLGEQQVDYRTLNVPVAAMGSTMAGITYLF